jgi:carboxyl-terminal processing protease
MKKIKIIILSASCLLLLGGFVSNYFEITKNLEIFNNLFREINTYYVDEINPGDLMETAIDGMLKELDPYTKYIPESDVEDFRFQTTGEYGGIGSLIRKIDNYVWIAEPYYNFPADKAGLKMGDKLLEIDGQKVNNINTDDVSSLLKGTPGTEVQVLAETTDGEVKEFSIIREKIHVPSVPYAGLIGNVGYVKLRSFTRHCTKEVLDSIESLMDKVNLDGLILDLRFNPGGLLNESINLANLFISKDETVVTTKGKIKEWDKTYKTKKEPNYPNLPIIVLINQGSASASEIIAGTLQDLDRAVILGARSFGKGLVQQSRKLNYNSQLKVTVAKYYTPSGRCIQSRDYALKDNDGLVKELEDSLRQSFTTRNGRIVYDGGGVDPDVKMDNIKYPEIIKNLKLNNYVFKFCNQYFKDVDNESLLSSFFINDDMFNNFIKYIEDEDFSFTVNSEDIIKELEQSLEDELYLHNMSQDIKVLKESILKHKKGDIEKYKIEIKKEIANDLITRLFYQSGRIQYNLKDDPYIMESIRLLSDQEEYGTILSSE